MVKKSMSKKNKFFSWLGFGKKKQQEEQAKVAPAEPELSEESPVEVAQEASHVEDAPSELEQTASDIASTEVPVKDDVASHEEQANNSIAETRVEESTFEETISPTNVVIDAADTAEGTSISEPETPETVEPDSQDAHEASSPEEHIAPSKDETVLINEPSEAPLTEELDIEPTSAVSDEEPANTEVAAEDIAAEPAIETIEEPQPKPEKKGFFTRLKEKLTKTKQSIGSGLANLFLGKKIDDELYEDLETQMLMADVGVDTTLKIINRLTEHADRKQLKDGDALYEKLKEELTDMLQDVDKPLEIDSSKSPYVVLMVGVNGVGKTTTIGKMAKQLQADGKSVMLAAGDTFRAAAVEQLQVWGQRNNIPVVAQHTGADSASVIFDAFESAKSRGVDVLIADTAGRLQNKDNLMEELKKVVRVMQKLSPDAPHEIMLTVDAGTGQNAISQAKLFNEAVGITGITLTKLDGTAKGGVIFSIADQFNIPIRYIGVGEGIDDLRPFNSQDFIQAIFSQESEEEA